MQKDYLFGERKPQPNPEPAGEGRKHILMDYPCGQTGVEYACKVCGESWPYAEGKEKCTGKRPEPSSPSAETKHWNDPSREAIGQAKEFLRQSGIRDVVLRHEGQPNEQTFSSVMAFYAVNQTAVPPAEELARRIAELEFLLRSAWTFVPPGGSLSGYIEKALIAYPGQKEKP